MQRFFRRLQQRLVWIYSRRKENVGAQRDDLLRMGEREADNVRTEQRPAYTDVEVVRSITRYKRFWRRGGPEPLAASSPFYPAKLLAG